MKIAWIITTIAMGRPGAAASGTGIATSDLRHLEWRPLLRCWSSDCNATSENQDWGVHYHMTMQCAVDAVRCGH
jgi:hypothetical protein